MAIPGAPIPEGVPTTEKKKGFSLFGHKDSTPKEKPVKEKPAKPDKKNKMPIPTGIPGVAIPGEQIGINGPKPTAPAGAPAQPSVPGQPAAPKPAGGFVAPVIQKQNSAVVAGMNFGETTVLNANPQAAPEIGATTILSPQMVMPVPVLVRNRTSEKITINKPVFRIGKERSYVDFFISDNTAISRSHANIVSRDGQYFIVDTNSTNHTFVNGAMLPANVETPIKAGDKIRLANEEFEFKMI